MGELRGLTRLRRLALWGEEALAGVAGDWRAWRAVGGQVMVLMADDAAVAAAEAALRPLRNRPPVPLFPLAGVLPAWPLRELLLHSLPPDPAAALRSKTLERLVLLSADILQVGAVRVVRL